MDCVEVCPVDCFHEGENMLVIDPARCIDCAACEPECPLQAIVPDSRDASGEWLAHNTRYAEAWPRITQKGTVPADADMHRETPDKLATHFSPKPGGSA
jgi:ferredoxin